MDSKLIAEMAEVMSELAVGEQAADTGLAPQYAIATAVYVLATEVAKLRELAEKVDEGLA